MAKSPQKIYDEVKTQLKKKNPELDNITDIQFKNMLWWNTHYGKKKVLEFYEKLLSVGVISEENMDDGKGTMRVIFNE